MSILPDRTESYSDSSVDIEDSDVEESSGWDDFVSPDEFFKSENQTINKKLIKLANDKFPLSSTLQKHQLKFTTRYSASGWTHVCLCPFFDHPEKTPSFGFNPREGRFNCFGCQRYGKTVEFLGFMENKLPIVIAKRLLGNSIDIESVIEEVVDEYDEKIDELIFQFSDDVLSFIKKHNLSQEAQDYADNCAKILDTYVRKNATSLSADIIEAITSKLRERFRTFGEE